MMAKEHFNALLLEHDIENIYLLGLEIDAKCLLLEGIIYGIA